MVESDELNIYKEKAYENKNNFIERDINNFQNNPESVPNALH